MQAAFFRPGPRARRLALASVLILAALARLAAIHLIPSPLESDYLGYWTLANNLSQGEGLSSDGRLSAFLSLGYPVFLSAVFSVFGSSVTAAQGASLVLGTLSVLLVFVAARNLFGSFLVALLSALLFAAYAEAVVYTAYVAKENVIVFLMVAQLALVSAPGRERWRLANAALFGVAIGWTAMVANVGLALVPGFVAQLYLTRVSGRGLAQYLIVAAIAAGLTASPLLWRNHAVFGAYVLNNNGGFNLYLGNNENATTQFISIADTPMGKEWQPLLDSRGEHEADVVLRGLAIDYMVSHPVRTAGLALRKAAAFWSPPLSKGKDAADKPAEQIVRWIWLAQYCSLCALALVGLLSFRQNHRPVTTLLLIILFYTAAHGAFYVMARYRLPIMPFVCMLAALGAARIAARLRPGRHGASMTSHGISSPV